MIHIGIRGSWAAGSGGRALLALCEDPDGRTPGGRHAVEGQSGGGHFVLLLLLLLQLTPLGLVTTILEPDFHLFNNS